MDEQACVLLVDIGNSRVKWAWGRRGKIEPGEPCATHAGQFPQAWEHAPAPAQMLVSNVAGQPVADALQAWAGQHWGLAPRFIRAEAHAYGVRNGYAYPEKLGVDRWVALIGARHACMGPVCVADCGTAITFDALDADGRHIGGLIAPGLGLMRQALARGTDALPMAFEEDGEGRLASETSAAIAAGTRLAAAGLVEQGFRAAARALGCEPCLLLTGGDAAVIAAGLDRPYELRPDLVLEGLFAISHPPLK